MNATEQYFPVVLFIMLYKVVLHLLHSLTLFWMLICVSEYLELLESNKSSLYFRFTILNDTIDVITSEIKDKKSNRLEMAFSPVK